MFITITFPKVIRKAKLHKRVDLLVHNNVAFILMHLYNTLILWQVTRYKPSIVVSQRAKEIFSKLKTLVVCQIHLPEGKFILISGQCLISTDTSKTAIKIIVSCEMSMTVIQNKMQL